MKNTQFFFQASTSRGMQDAHVNLSGEISMAGVGSKRSNPDSFLTVEKKAGFQVPFCR
jgi:hypothetical protein